MLDSKEYLNGRGSQVNWDNKFQKAHYVLEHIEGLDEEMLSNSKTEFFHEHPKKIVNKVESPDLKLMYSMNPYQGCEHGCIYCYARNSHEYWGYSAGLDFERKIIIKENAALLLEKTFDNPRWEPYPIMLSGNTDCYQPIERKKKITRSLLEIFLKYKHPVSIITKNSLVLRDTDILSELAKLSLVNVNVSITSLDESLRQMLEPRTTTAKQRLKVAEVLSKENVPVNIMIAPLIPGLNVQEIPKIMKAASEAGASSAGYTVVRLNGAIKNIFEDWIHKAFPDKAEKVLNQIKECHGGTLNDSRWGTRMRGEGNIASMIANLFDISHKKYFKNEERRELDCSIFKRPEKGQLSLF